MKTTLEIADDVLIAAEELSRSERKTPGEVISELARKALLAERKPNPVPADFLGFRPFLSRGGIVTNEKINELREKDAI